MPTAAQLKITAKRRTAFLDRDQFRRMFSEANRVALIRAGVRIRDAAKKGIGNNAPHKPKKQSLASEIAHLDEVDGGLYKDLSAGAGKKARPAGKPIKSWAPRRWVYNDIKFYWDFGGQSVVIGPYRTPWLNRLHEFGGSEKLVQWSTGANIARRAKAIRDRGGRLPRRLDGTVEAGFTRWVTPGRGFKGQKVRGFIRPWTKTGNEKTVRYPARPFMQGSAYVQRALGRIAEDFRDTLHANGEGGVGLGRERTERVA